MNYLSPANLLKGAAVFALFLCSSLIVNAQLADSKNISELFNEIKQHATFAQGDAELLDSYTRGNISWQSHARRLAEIKDHVDELLADYNHAQVLRDEGSPWQQDAIDQLRPVLKGMADQLTATLQYQNENQSQVKLQPYLDYVRGNRDYVMKASSLIHDLVDYGAAKSTAESLEHKLKMP